MASGLRSSDAAATRVGWLSADSRQRLTRRSAGRGIGLFLLDLAFYAVCFVVAARSGPLLLRVAAGVLGGLGLTLLFVIGHDACHQSLTPHRWMNHLAGRIAFLPVLHTFSLWELAHNELHHRYTNLLSQDYVWRPLTWQAYQSMPRWRRPLYRLERSAAGLLAYYPLRIWLAKLAFPWHPGIGRLRVAYFVDSALVWAFLALECALAARLAAAPGAAWAWSGVACAVVLPLLVFWWLIGGMIYLQHTHPRVAWFEDPERWSFFRGQVASSVHVRLPAALDAFFQRVLHHTAHHALPGIPIYHLAEAQRRIEESWPAAVVVLRWSPSAHLDVVRRCKLFDADRSCWVDFQGRPTSEAIALA